MLLFLVALVRLCKPSVAGGSWWISQKGRPNGGRVTGSYAIGRKPAAPARPQDDRPTQVRLVAARGDAATQLLMPTEWSRSPSARTGPPPRLLLAGEAMPPPVTGPFSACVGATAWSCPPPLPRPSRAVAAQQRACPLTRQRRQRPATRRLCAGALPCDSLAHAAAHPH